MPYSNRNYRRHDQDDVWTPGDIVQMDAVVTACALVAQADGWVTPDERKRMIDRMRRSPAIAFFGVDEVVLAFEALKIRFDHDPDEAEAMAEDAISKLRGQSGPSRLLIETACSVAEADGGFDAEEREVILRLCGILHLDPAPYGLSPADERRR